ncbi:transposase family protein [Streptomyces sp. NPDC052036]|uniref:transposase family protein n=1 Tax=Streptomyces sp. NPDC052036 TaxID=3155171 RepID=UPI0034394021
MTRPRDLPHGGSPVLIRWHKRRWQCRERQCGRGSFTEQIVQIPSRMRLTERLRTACGQDRRVRRQQGLHDRASQPQSEPVGISGRLREEGMRPEMRPQW